MVCSYFINRKKAKTMSVRVRSHRTSALTYPIFFIFIQSNNRMTTITHCRSLELNIQTSLSVAPQLPVSFLSSYEKCPNFRKQAHPSPGNSFLQMERFFSQLTLMGHSRLRFIRRELLRVRFTHCSEWGHSHLQFSQLLCIHSCTIFDAIPV